MSASTEGRKVTFNIHIIPYDIELAFLEFGRIWRAFGGFLWGRRCHGVVLYLPWVSQVTSKQWETDDEPFDEEFFTPKVYRRITEGK